VRRTTSSADSFFPEVADVAGVSTSGGNSSRTCTPTLAMMKKYICAAARWLLLSLRRVVDRCGVERPEITHDQTIHFHALQVLLTACRARNRAIHEETPRRVAGEEIVMVSDAAVAVVLDHKANSRKPPAGFTLIDK
jgi:hypothetical protein